MKADDETLSLEELCARSDFTERTVRYYIQRGLLPSPGSGRGSRYGKGYLYRLRLIKRMQSQHVPLAEIEKRLRRMSEREIAEQGIELAQSRSSASDYIDSILSRGKSSVARKTETTTAPDEKEVGDAASSETVWSRWDRMRLSADVELHVSRPQSREMNRKIERIVAAARRILDEE